MQSIQYLPPVALAVSAGRLLSGRIRFPKEHTGKHITMESGEEYCVFSDVQVIHKGMLSAGAPAVLCVRFRFDRYPDSINRRLFLLFTPIITGMPGFHRKIWSYCESGGIYQGIYQFESVKHVDQYKRSLVLWILEKRSVPGSISHDVFPDISIADYLYSFLKM